MIINRIRRHSKYIFLFISVLWMIFTGSLLFIQNRTKYIILMNFLDLHLRPVDLVYIFTIIIALWCIYGLRMAWKKYSKKIIKIIIIIGWIGLILAFLFGSFVVLLNHSVTKYHEFSSPDKRYTLIVRESSFLLLSEISLYERKNPFFIEKIKNSNVGTDDGYTPISQGSYWIKWNKNTVTLAIDGNWNNQSWTTIKVIFEKNKHKSEIGTIYPKGKPSYITDDSGKKKANQSNAADKKIQDKLNNLSVDNVIKIPNSEFGIIQVDQAMSRVQWFFVKISENKMAFISELPDTKPNVNAKMNVKGVIFITFKDINGNTSKYKSADQGKSWIKIRNCVHLSMM